MTFQTIEEQNQHLNAQGLAGYDSAFVLTFRDRKKAFFEIKYGEHGHLKQNPYFSTTAGILNHIRSDWNQCGQAQESVLRNKHLKAFYKKWDVKHCKVLTLEERAELEADINALKENIPYIEGCRFYEIVKFDRELSNPRKAAKQ